VQDRIEIEVVDGVADVRLVRSDKMNALDGKMFQAIEDAGKQLAADSSVRVVVLSGEGRSFCAGLDTSNFAAMADTSPDSGTSEGSGEKKAVPETLSERTHGLVNRAQYAAWMWRELEAPVIAAVHGVALGAGFQLALGADMRYVAPGTKMSVMEIKWGLVPDMAGMPLMRNLARDDVIRELTYTGRIFLAEEALEMGFVTVVVDDPRAHALDLARQIAGKNPDAIKADKRLLNAANDVSVADLLMMESVEQDAIIRTPNQIEAVMAEMQKRPANFS
jgi:enoyl-CoA hydratase/carnithine racemase